MALMICSAQETFIFDMQPRQKEHFSQLAPIRRNAVVYKCIRSVLDFTFNHNMISTQGIKTSLTHQSPTIHDFSDRLSEAGLLGSYCCQSLMGS